MIYVRGHISDVIYHKSYVRGQMSFSDVIVRCHCQMSLSDVIVRCPCHTSELYIRCQMSDVMFRCCIIDIRCHFKKFNFGILLVVVGEGEANMPAGNLDNPQHIPYVYQQHNPRNSSRYASTSCTLISYSPKILN